MKADQRRKEQVTSSCPHRKLVNLLQISDKISKISKSIKEVRGQMDREKVKALVTCDILTRRSRKVKKL